MPQRRIKKQSSKTIPKLKAEAWKWFSQYIRLRDCKKTTGTYHMGICITCGKTYEYTKLQAGHFLPGRSASILFDEDQVHAQCMQCNVWDHGKPFVYLQKMREMFGFDAVEKMIAQKHEVSKWDRGVLEALKTKYKQKVISLIGK